MRTDKAIRKPIVEELYTQALVLADEVRAIFDVRENKRVSAEGDENDAMRIALSIEGLRTTTRVMHMLAWLLNQRAYLEGELSKVQMERHGALAEERPSDPAQLRQLMPETQSLIRESEKMYDRIARLDESWRQASADAVSGVQNMQSRIASAFGG